MRWCYWRPINDAVKSAMRIDSVEPLIDGVPAHDEMEGIVSLDAVPDSSREQFLLFSSKLNTLAHENYRKVVPHVGVGRKEEMRMCNCKNGRFNQGNLCVLWSNGLDCILTYEG